MRKYGILLALFSCGVLAATTFEVPTELASNGSQFGEDATVYVFRDAIDAGKVWSTSVSVDGVERGSLSERTFIRLRVPAGVRRFELGASRWMRVPKVDVSIPIAASRTYRLAYSISQQPLIAVTATLDPISKEEADRRLQTYGERYNADTMPTPEQLAAAQARMPAWQAAVLERARAAWQRPAGSKGPVHCELRAKFADNGRLANLGWIQATGDSTLDRSIINAFKDAAPYPAPPDPEQARAGIALTFTDEAPHSALVPLSTARPQMPEAACRDKIVGWVTLDYTVTMEGKVQDVSVVDSAPKGLYEQTAIDSVSHWVYAPWPKARRVRQKVPFDPADCINASR